MRWFCVLMGFLGIFYFSWADADMASADVLNEATVVVPNQSAMALQSGLQTAFDEVMIKLSNDPTIVNQPAIQQASTHAMQWVQSYTYLQQSDATGQSVLLLQAIFDQAGLQSFLQPVAQKKLSQPASNQLSSIARVSIQGVQSMVDYSNILKNLRQMQGVQSVDVKDLQGSQLNLAIHVLENLTQFTQILSKNNHFRATTSDFQPAGETQKLVYAWMG